jgi:hypothetical protein
MSKTTKPIIREHNVETGEIIDREMTDQEFLDHKTLLADVAAKELERENQKAEKQALLDRLGITADEAKLLLG